MQARQQLVKENLEAGRKLKVGQQPVQIILHLASGELPTHPDWCSHQQTCSRWTCSSCMFIRAVALRHVSHAHHSQLYRRGDAHASTISRCAGHATGSQQS